jgi:hypothetical protein
VSGDLPDGVTAGEMADGGVLPKGERSPWVRFAN